MFRYDLTEEQYENVKNDYTKGYKTIKEIAASNCVEPRILKYLADDNGWDRPFDYIPTVGITIKSIKRSYESNVLKLSEISKIYNISKSTVMNYAKKFGWKRKEKEVVSTCESEIKQCRQCKYFNYPLRLCEYMIKTDEMRGCDVKNCTKFTKVDLNG